MISYKECIKIIEERCGNGKDNAIALSTIAIAQNNNNKPRPCVRDVDAYYEDGSFYITTWAKSNKMQQIDQNPEVAFSVFLEWFSGNGIAKNLGWVLDEKNAELRLKLRKVFAEWYDYANKEEDENCIILAVRITWGILVQNHGANRYYIDFINKTVSE